jgi:hypothetical protein
VLDRAGESSHFFEMTRNTRQTGSEWPELVTAPERSRLRLIALLLSSLLLGGSQAQCSFMSGDQRDEEKHDNENDNDNDDQQKM